MFNIMYADREGNIFYAYNGAVPRRPTKFNWSKPVDGSNPEAEWQGYHTIRGTAPTDEPKNGLYAELQSNSFYHNYRR